METGARRLKMSGRSKFGVGGANLVWVEQIRSGWSKFGVGGADLGGADGQNSVEGL